jgi:hypothetical protein
MKTATVDDKDDKKDYDNKNDVGMMIRKTMMT